MLDIEKIRKRAHESGHYSDYLHVWEMLSFIDDCVKDMTEVVKENITFKQENEVLKKKHRQMEDILKGFE